MTDEETSLLTLEETNFFARKKIQLNVIMIHVMKRLNSGVGVARKYG